MFLGLAEAFTIDLLTLSTVSNLGDQPVQYVVQYAPSLSRPNRKTSMLLVSNLGLEMHRADAGVRSRRQVRPPSAFYSNNWRLTGRRLLRTGAETGYETCFATSRDRKHTITY
jgi:hypothetical protein